MQSGNICCRFLFTFPAVYHINIPAHYMAFFFFCGRFHAHLRESAAPYSSFFSFLKVISEMKRHRSVNLLLMLVLLVAVGQMAQTIYIPAIADMARELNVREGAVQSVMAAYLLTYGLSQLVYGPLSDRVGRRPVILAGCLFLCWPRWSRLPPTA